MARGKAFRRHHSNRMKAKARRIYSDHPNAEKYADHLKMCSCFMCGNARKHQGPTLQERRHISPSSNW